MGLYCGIDTGADGALVVVDFSNQTVLDMVDFKVDCDRVLTVEVMHEIQSVLDKHKEGVVQVCVEKVWARPGQSALATWSQASAYASLVSVLQFLGHDTKKVAPITWKRGQSLTCPKETPPHVRKQVTRDAILRDFPWAGELVPLKKHHGRADAFFIARHAWLENEGI